MRTTQQRVVSVVVGFLAGVILSSPWSAWSTVDHPPPPADDSCESLREARFMGIAFQNISVPPTGDVRFSVDYLCPDSPAQLAGLQEGDVVTHVNGEAVAGWRATIAACRRAIREGDVVRLQLWRTGRTVNTTVDLDDWK